MKVVVIGKSGQLAYELTKTKPENVELLCLGRDDIDLSSESDVHNTLRSLAPDVVINSAAYTQVDKAESEIDEAFALNATAVATLAKICKSLACYFVQVSTDFVFAGEAKRPYKPDDKVSPQGVYARSKQKGEQILLDTYPQRSVIVRTSWLYSAHGNNFVKTMLKLMNKLEKLSIVADQIGSPTWADGLARFIWTLTLSSSYTGVFHWCDKGATSWFDFALEIYRQGRALGLINNDIEINQTTTAEYGAPAPRPAYSVMDSSGSYALLDGQLWQNQLSAALKEMNA